MATNLFQIIEWILKMMGNAKNRKRNGRKWPDMKNDMEENSVKWPKISFEQYTKNDGKC